jgi:serine/threonine-protein kinase RsbW
MTHTLTIRNDFLALRKMSGWLEETGVALGISSEQRFEVDLMANEAVTNVVSYGYTGGRVGEIEIRLGIAGNDVVLEIEDDGRAFNPLEVEARVAPDGIDDARVGGLGIHLIRMTAAECLYRREGEHNVFTMKAPLKDPASGPAAPKG